MVAIKICGITSRRDAELCVSAGANALGLNFYAGSPRCVSPATARAIVEAVGDRVLTVGVFVDASYEEILEVKRSTGVECVQLHGDESPELLQRLLPHAYKALRVRDAASLAQAAAGFGGDYLLLDAYVPQQPGGTGRCFDWELARTLARQRKLALAGGLTPHNVAEAVATVAPYCVDVASGVESAPGTKDPALVHAFIRAASR